MKNFYYNHIWLKPIDSEISKLNFRVQSICLVLLAILTYFVSISLYFQFPFQISCCYIKLAYDSIQFNLSPIYDMSHDSNISLYIELTAT